MRTFRPILTALLLSLSFVIGAPTSPRCLAQETADVAQTPQEAGQNDSSAQQDPGSTDMPSQNVGVVRMVRFSLVEGDVRWRTEDSQEWSAAVINLPVPEKSQIVAAEGRAELRFDDGSVLRLNAGAKAVLQTLSSDAQGEVTEINLLEGTASLRLMNDHSAFQVDTPLVAAKASGPGKLRVDSNQTVGIWVKDGSTQVEGHQGATLLHSNEFLEVQNTVDGLRAMPLPADDDWENWNSERDRQLDQEIHRVPDYLPPNMAIASPDLNAYGGWREVAGYGHVWIPRVEEGWRPYAVGHWVWSDPYGWTWVSSEAWGWAPYHYGTWARTAFGWGWVPGPACQCWSPAVVHFCAVDGAVAWVPLAPSEVFYPRVFAVGAFGPYWMRSFSIGMCGVYYPGARNRCFARIWSNIYVNHFRTVGIVRQSFHGAIVNRNISMGAGSFVPRNSRFNGASMASLATIQHGGHYSALPAAKFAALHPHALGVPAAGSLPVAGLPALKPRLATVSAGSVKPAGNGNSRFVARSGTSVNRVTYAPRSSAYPTGASSYRPSYYSSVAAANTASPVASTVVRPAYNANSATTSRFPVPSNVYRPSYSAYSPGKTTLPVSKIPVRSGYSRTYTPSRSTAPANAMPYRPSNSSAYIPARTTTVPTPNQYRPSNTYRPSINTYTPRPVTGFRANSNGYSGFGGNASRFSGGPTYAPAVNNVQRPMTGGAASGGGFAPGNIRAFRPAPAQPRPVPVQTNRTVRRNG